MTVETAINVEGDKCGVEMRSTCEDPSPKSVGGGCECNGGGDSKDDYVFVNDCDVNSDDHVEVDGNNGELNDGDVSEAIDGVSGKVGDNVVMVNGGESKLDNVVVVKEESEFVKVNGEIKVEEEGVIEDKEVIVESNDRSNNGGEVDVGDRDLEAVEESDVKSRVDEDMVVKKEDECNASVVSIDRHSLDNADKFDGSGSDGLQSGSEIVKHMPQQVEENEICTKEPEKPEVEVKEPEVVDHYVNSHFDEVSVNKSESMDDIAEDPKPIEADIVHKSQDDYHIETKALDSCGAEALLPDNAITEKESENCHVQDLQQVENGDLGPVETVVEVREQVDLDPSEVKGFEDLKSLDSEATACDFQQSVDNQDVLDSTPESEDKGVEDLKSVDSEAIACDLQQGVENQDVLDSTPESEEKGVEDLKSLDSEATTCDLQQGVENEDATDLTPESEDKGVEDVKSLDSEATTCDLQQGVENQDVPVLTSQSEDCQELQGVPEQSEGEDNLSDRALTASEVDGSAQESTDQCEVITTDMMQEVTGTLDSSTVTVQSDIIEKPVDVSDTVHEGRVEDITQVERSLECSVQEASPIDQVVEDNGLVDEKVPSEDISLNEAASVEETDNSSMVRSADEAVEAEESKDLDVCDLKDGVPDNDVTVLESSRDPGSCLTSDGGDLTGSFYSQVAPPVSHDTDMINEQGVVDDGSNVDESSFEPNSEICNDDRPSSVVGTEIEVKPANCDVHDMSKESFGSDGTLRFGSFVCQTKSNGVSTTLTDVNAQLITDEVPASSPLERSAISTNFSDANPQIATDVVSASPIEESRADPTDGDSVSPVRSPFRWLIKVPRLDDVEFEQIKKFQMELEKKTQDRDGFRKVLMERMATFQEVKDKLHAAKAEERNAHQLLMAKKREIDSSQSLLKLARDGNTVERIDGQILNMERRIQHETMDLAEEKKLIREIKLLNSQRERLAADTQGQQEIYQAVGRRVETEEQLKVLRKELDTLRDNHSKAYERFKAAERKFEEESTSRRKLEAEKDSLARIRQEAYEHFQALKKQAFEKNKPCYNYRDAKKDVLNLKAGEEESLERICVNQVENFMELWNKDDKFRKEYIRCNKRSTLRRFNTLDGRELGIDEKRPSLEDSSDNGVTSAKVNTVPTASILEREFPLIAKKAKEDDSSEKVTDKKNTNTIAKKRGETTSSNGLAEPSGRIETEEKEGPKISKEEEELARKAEQKRKEEVEELLKEKRRLEEKAKAQEALERKKRMAEKAQARAKFKAEKEAEEKRKEKEKRAKKKGKKNSITSEPTEVEPAQVPESSSETTRKPEITEKPSTVVKKTHKPTALYTKQVKTTKSIPAPPAPLRNRGKRRIPQWAWWLVLAIFTALLIFPLGSIDIVGLLKPFVTGSYK